jgi:hypothetical protein
MYGNKFLNLEKINTVNEADPFFSKNLGDS